MERSHPPAHKVHSPPDCVVPLFQEKGAFAKRQGELVAVLLLALFLPLCLLAQTDSKIAFASSRDGNYEIYVMDADGTNQTRLTNLSTGEGGPSWSPAGDKIIFESDRDGNLEIYVVNADGTNSVRLTNNSASDFNASWSPDGTKIAFRTNRDGNEEIYVMNADGTNPVNLTNHSARDGEPHWSLDGSKIVFSSWRSGSAEIYSMNSDGSNVNLLTSGTTWSGDPHWSPDGSKIVYGSFGDIYVMNAAGTNPVNLTNSGVTEGAATWSPDGGKLVFYQGSDSATREIYVMNSDGSNPIRLTNNTADDQAPFWSPFIYLAPAVPTNLVATPGDQQISLQWSANSEANFLRYRIYGDTTTAPTTVVDSTTGGNLNDTTATFTNLSNGTPYYYRITAVDSLGNESAYSTEVSATPVGLVAYYPFNGNANDESANSNDGTVTGATLTADRYGDASSAYGFDGVDDYVEISDSETLNPNQIALETWFKTDLLGNRQTIITKDFTDGSEPFYQYHLEIRTTGTLYFSLSIDGTRRFIDEAFSITTGRWYHAVGTYDGNTIRLYLNGEEFSTPTVISGTLDSYSTNLLIGKNLHQGLYFDGTIDDIRIYNRALTATEIRTLYLEGPPAAPTNLTASAGNQQIGLTWSPNSEADFRMYCIYGDTATAPTTRIDSTTGGNLNDTTATLTGLTNGATYYYRITAVDSSGNESAYSNEVNATTYTPLEVDSLALVDLYNSTTGASWTNNTNWLTSSSLSSWNGVTVFGGRVSKLNFFNNNLSGPIPPEIGKLTSMQELHFQGNNLTGSIPAEIGNLDSLVALFLWGNELTGAIPDTIGSLSNLTGLYLHYNQLTGIVPAAIDKLSSLIGFYLNNNQLSSLPDLSAISTLQDLRIQNNRFTFEDIEPNIGVPSTTFTYSPQDSVGTEQSVTVREGDRLLLPMTVGGTSNQYQWLLDGVDITGATDDTLVIASVSMAGSGAYVLRTTNTVATALTIYSRPTNITVLMNDPPAAPVELTATIVTPGIYAGNIKLNWTANTEPDFRRYLIYESLSSDFSTGVPAAREIMATTAFTLAADGANANQADDLNALAQTTTPLISGDAINLSGTLPDGTPAAATFTYGTDGTTLGDLIGVIDVAFFNGAAIALLFDGKLWIQDVVPGISSTSLSFATAVGIELPTMDDILIPGSDGATAGITDYAEGIGSTELIEFFTENITHYFRITAVDSSGNESGFSNQTSAFPPDITLPLNPLNLRAIAGDRQIDLTWSPNIEADFLKYYIYGGVTAAPTTLVDSTAGGNINDTTATLAGLSNGATYYYRITAIDSSGNESAYSAEVSATPLSQLAFPGNALQFDGVDDYVEVPDGDQWAFGDNPFSLALWVQLNDGTASVSFIANDEGSGTLSKWAFWKEDAELRFHIKSLSLGALYPVRYTWTPNNGQWYHLAVTRDGSSYVLYIDGVNVYTNTLVSTVPNPNAPLTFGQAEGIYYLNGAIDEVRIWNVARTQADIQGSMHAQLTGSETGLVGYWRMDEASGLTAFDYSANGNHGALNGGVARVTSTVPTVADTTPPAIPTGLTATAGDQQITLAWSPNSEADFLRYRIYGGTATAPTAQIDSTTAGINDTTATITGLGNGTAYYFRITAVDSTGNESAYSSEVSATTYTLLEVDSLALVDLYNSTNSGSWTTSTNWLTSASLSTWYGVTVASGRVTNLNLASNNLAGPIPATIGNLTNLIQLRLFDNQLSGPIPIEIGNLTNLTGLYLYNNQLTGSIPPEIGNLTNLTHLVLSNNQLTGSIPTEIGTLTILDALHLNNNQLTGSIPATIGNLTNLTTLWLDQNLLTGSIPAEIGILTALTILRLQVNLLTGAIPDTVGNLTNLNVLLLSTNNLTGTIPTAIGNLTNLTHLWLDNNNLTGTIPDSIVNLTNLQFMYLYDNQLVDLPSLGAITTLVEFRVENNRFTFEDIEPNIGVASTTFTYSPQDSVGIEQDTTVADGTSLTLSVAVGGAANQYQWVQDGLAISGATSDSLVFSTISLADSGSYLLRTTNTVATALTLYSRPINVTIIDVPPAAPTGLTVTGVGDGTVSLSWNPNSEGDFLRYRIYGGAASGPTTVVDSTTDGNLNDTTATLTGLSNGTTYYYRITSVDSGGNESAYSNEVNVTPGGVVDGYYEIKHDVFNASKWFGGDDRPGFTPRDVGVGQSVFVDKDIILESFSFYFIERFDFEANPEGFGHAVTLVLNIRDSSGVTLQTERVRVPATFNGGWVPWPNINRAVPANSQLIFTSYLAGAYDSLQYTAGVAGDADASYTGGLGYSKQGSGDADMEYWTGWFEHPWDFDIWLRGNLIAYALRPLPPTGLTATAGDGQIDLHWNPNAEDDFFKYYINGGTTTAPTTRVDSTAGGNLNDTTATLIGLSNGTTYFYRITAVDSSGNASAYSGEVNATPVDLTAPAIPAALAATAGDGQINLHWNPNAEADFLHYRVYGGTVTAPTTVVDSTTGGDLNDTTATLTGLSNGTTYYYRITAVDSAGNESAYSNEVSATPQAVDLTTDLVAYYPFSGNANDESGNGNHGTEMGGITLTADRFGNANSAYSFDGVDDYILITSRVQVSNEASFSFWLNTNELKESHILSKRIKSFDPALNDWQLGMDDASGAFQARLWGTSNDNHKTGSGFLITGEWAFVTVVYDGSKVDIYKNGVLFYTKINSGAINDRDYDLRIGDDWWGNIFNGIIDDIRIYNRALTTAEITALYTEGGWPSQDTIPPAAPTNLAANAGDGQVSLAWSPNAEADFSKYYVYGGTAAAPTTLVDSTTGGNLNDTTATLTGLLNGTTYYYRITAADSSGNESAYSSEVSETPVGLVAWYPFNGNANDESANSNDGTVNGATLTVDRFGNANSAYSFDGVDDYIDMLQPGPLGTQARTITAWAKSRSIYELDQIISYGGDNLASPGASFRLGLLNIVDCQGVSANTSVSASNGEAPSDINVWHQYILVVPAMSNPTTGDIKIYRDGILLSTACASVNLSTAVNTQTGSPIRIGMMYTGGDNYAFDGLIDDIRIYNRALSATEVDSLYRLGGWPSIDTTAPAAPTGLVAIAADQQITLTWPPNAEGNFLRYRIYGGVTASPTALVDSTASGNLNDTTATLTGLTNGVTYHYRITAVDSAGNESAYSNEDSATPRAPLVTAVTYATRTYEVITEQGLDLSFPLRIGNAGNTALAYDLTFDADWFGFQWLTAAVTSGIIPAGDSTTALIGVVETANLNEGDYTGFIHVHHNSGSDLEVRDITNTLTVNLHIEPTGTVAAGNVTVGSGNTAPVELTDSNGNSLGLTLDFINSLGGSVTALAAHVPPPADAATPFNDPEGAVTRLVYAPFYWEITTDIPAGFTVDITFDYSRLIGINNPDSLRLARRPAFAGTDTPWQLLSYADVSVNSPDSLITAIQQGQFSQWTIVSDSADNPFADVLPPAITVASPGSQAATSGVALTIAAEVTDESQISAVTLNYFVGGTSQAVNLDMTLTTGSSYEAEIPAADVTPPGLAYFVAAADNLSHSALTDTISVAVSFAENALTSAGSGSFFASGFPKDKWRLIGLPGDLDSRTLQATIQDELGGAPGNETWGIYQYNGSGLEDYSAATSLVMGESYWLKQLVADDVAFSLGSGKSVDLAGYDITLAAGAWNLVASPYPFEVGFEPDDATHYGPFTYGPFGSSGQEGWSLGSSTLTLKPWGGYIIFNKSSVEELLALRPLGLPKSIAKTTALQGWTLTFTAEGANYVDFGNVIGRIAGASEGLDRHDQPELPFVEGYLSMTMENELWSETHTPRTTDLRGDDLDNGVWNLAIRSKDEQSPITLRYRLDSSAKDGLRRVLVDQVTREQHFLGEEGEILLRRYTEAFPRRLNVVVGDAQFVAGAVEEILSGLPEAFALAPNYPNPFNPNTTLRYALPHPARGSLKVYNLLGQEIISLVQGWMDMGRHEIVWDGRDGAGRNLASGIYFAVFAADGKIITRKMVLLK
ncbi:MAG: fibronectin type III domain-containing protein [Candidatus Marinimicrobia bacterium]|nr:fibronectin type III domain-containing protein [Candidatus Neomarinimicrobiota bacterium]